MNKLTAEWIKKADDDFDVARRLLRGRGQYPDQVCFHCQQAATYRAEIRRRLKL